MKKPPHWDPSDALSLKALAAGVASEQQQKIALEWITEAAGMLKEGAYQDNDRDTAFCLGRQYVARMIAYLVEMPNEAIEEVRKKDEQRSRERVYGTPRNRPAG